MIPRRRAGAFAALLVVSCSACSRTPTELPAGEASAPSPPGPPTPQAPPSSPSSPDDDWGTTADGGRTLFPLGPLPADAPFQGRISLQIAEPVDTDTEPDSTEIARYDFTVQGKKARWDLFSRGGKGRPVGYRIYDGEQRKFFTVMRQPQIFVTNESALESDAAKPRAWAFTPFAQEPHGKVQDYPCDLVDTQDDTNRYHLCLAKGLPVLPLHLLGPALGVAVPFGAALEKKGLFPLTVIVRPRKIPDGGAIAPLAGKLTLLALERGLVPDNAFVLPKFPSTETPKLVAPGILR